MINWDMYRWETEFAFDNLADYLNIIEGQFASFRELERNKISRNPPTGLSEEQLADWQAEIQLFEEQYDRDFPSNIRYSFLILLYIVFETRLKAICDEISKRKGLDLREKEHRDTALERADTFFQKIAKLPKPEPTLWKWLDDFQKVRNCIVHANGKLELSKDVARLKALCNAAMGLSSCADLLVIERCYCEKTLEVTKSYFKHLFDSAGFGKG